MDAKALDHPDWQVGDFLAERRPPPVSSSSSSRRFLCLRRWFNHTSTRRPCVCVGGDIHYVLHCIYVAICFWPSRVVSSDGRRRRGIKEKRNSRKAEELKRHNVQRPLAQRPGLMMDGQARLAFDGRFLLSTCPTHTEPRPSIRRVRPPPFAAKLQLAGAEARRFHARQRFDQRFD